VDDSEAVLAFESVALSRFYAITTARDGREALEKVDQLRPAAVLLDLSMPVLDGDEVLARMVANPDLSAIPVIIISSEQRRAEECLRLGAAAYLPKPLRADELLQTVGRVIEQARVRARQGGLAVLPLTVGPLKLAVPLDAVFAVAYRPATSPLPGGPSYLQEYVEVRGEIACVLCLARRLAVAHTLPLIDRKLVVIRHDRRLLLALCVDEVRDPVEHGPDELVPAPEAGTGGGAEDGPLSQLLVTLVRSGGEHLPVIQPRGLLSRGLLRQLPSLLPSSSPRGSVP
jgi:CheY-like chemotaxis protein/chemotaxis signal transduction protein